MQDSNEGEALPSSNDDDSNAFELAFTPSVSIGDIFAKSRMLQRKGEDIIHLDAGEPDFGPPEEVVRATWNALTSGKNRYTEPAGIIEARKAIADHLNAFYKLDLSPKQVLITCGARMALYLIFSWLPRQSIVGMIMPYYPAFKEMTRYKSLHACFFNSDADGNWNPSLKSMREDDWNAMILNSPSNPTGKIMERRSMEAIGEEARTRNAPVISDEVYADYVFNRENSGYRSALQLDGCRALVISSFSKTYAMTGYRAGYVVGDEKTIAELEKINRMILLSPPEFTQYAIIAALECAGYVKEKVELIKSRRDAAVKALRNYIGIEVYPPEGALYLFPRIGQGRRSFDCEKFALELLDTEHVALTPGTVFGSRFRDYVRLTLLQSEERLVEGIKRMARLLQ
jgi:aspartate/methionine/tyrosine aminotransferase